MKGRWVSQDYEFKYQIREQKEVELRGESLTFGKLVAKFPMAIGPMPASPHVTAVEDKPPFKNREESGEYQPFPEIGHP